MLRRLSCFALAAAVAVAVATPPSAQSARGRAPRGMVITGRVLAPDGRPVPKTFVTALHNSPVPGRAFRFVSARLRAVTNERGEFQLDGLYAGEFFLIALPHNEATDAEGNPRRTGFGNTFYPGVASFAEAKSVRVRPGIPGTADITLLPAQIHGISGVVIGANGKPAPGGRLLVSRGDGFFGLDTAALYIGADGSFRVSGLQPGTYFLVFRESQWPPTRGTTPRISQRKVVITDADISNVRVEPLRMVRATGRLVVDPDARGSLDLRTVVVSASPDPIDGNPGPQRSGPVNHDGSFEFHTWPQPGRIRVSFEIPGWTMKAVRYKGSDITNRPIDFVQGEEVTGLEVVVTRTALRR